MGAVQPFISGSIQKPSACQMKLIEGDNKAAICWAIGGIKKPTLLYRDGSKLSTFLPTDDFEKQPKHQKHRLDGKKKWPRAYPSDHLRCFHPIHHFSNASCLVVERKKLPEAKRRLHCKNQNRRTIGCSHRWIRRRNMGEDLPSINIKKVHLTVLAANCFAIAVSIGLQIPVCRWGKEFADKFTFTRSQRSVDHPEWFNFQLLIMPFRLLVWIPQLEPIWCVTWHRKISQLEKSAQIFPQKQQAISDL